MWRTLLCLALMAFIITPSRAIETNNAPTCATYATVSFPRTLHCPSSSSHGVSVTWCLTCPLSSGSICFNRTSVTSVSKECVHTYTSGGELSINQYSGRYSFVGNTSMFISNIDVIHQHTMFNCTCQYYLNGSTCGGKSNFTLNLDNPGRTTYSTPISDIGVSYKPSGPVVYGTKVILCISGSSDGYKSVSWKKDSAPPIAVQDITNNITCKIRNCQKECFDNFSNLPGTSTEQYTAYMIMPYYEPCSQSRMEYVSVLIIDQVSAGDEGLYSFLIVSYANMTIKNQNSIVLSPAYENVPPIFYCAREAECPRSGQNAMFSCNVSLTHNSSVQWFYQASSSLAPVPIPYLQLNVSAEPWGESQLSELCSGPHPAGAFAIYLGQTAVPRPPKGVTATLYLSTLVVCGASSEASAGHYYSAVGNVQGPGCTLLPPADPSTYNSLVVFGVVMALTFVVVLLVAVLCVRQCWVRRKAVNIMAPVSLHMRPLLMHQTSSLHSPDETGLLMGLQTPRDRWDFPRANLEFVALLGEGQFGQVWKAQATGICSDEGRNIVAVKTVKLHASPSDVDELYAELEIMKHIEPHPNILNLLGQCSQTDTQPLCILMEFACYGSLKDYLQRCGEHVKQRNSAKVFTASSDTLTPPTVPLSTHVCDYHHQVLGHLNHYLTQAAVRESWHDYLPMSSVREENQDQEGGVVPHRKDGSPCLQLPHPQEAEQRSERDLPLYHEAWQVGGGLERLGTPDLGQEASNRSSYVYQQEQLSECGTSPQPMGEQQQYYQQPSQQGNAPGDQQLSEVGTSPGYHQAGGQRGTSPGYHQAGGQRGTSPGYQTGGQRGTSPGYQTGRQRGTSPGCQAGIQQLTVPQDPRLAKRSETPLSCQPSMDCMYCSQAGHYRNLEKGEGSSAKVGEGAEPVELMTSDVLNFSLQIVRGMEHLESMKYVHRDLAARNVLIAEGFLLKIGDFGLTRDLSEREYYKKITAGKLPARWMAIESLQSRKHTYKSDVWSFGIVLWEMFTYGAVPYGRLPAANSCESLANYLKRGERLSQPPNCSDDLYQLMLRCWNENVDQRPSFSDLKKIFDDLLSSTHGYLRMVSDTVTEGKAHEAHIAEVVATPFCEEPLQSHTPTMNINPEPLVKCAPISTLSPVSEDCSPQQGSRAYTVTRPLVQSRSLDFKETVL